MKKISLLLFHILIGIVVSQAQTFGPLHVDVFGQILTQLTFQLEPEDNLTFNLVENEDIQPQGRGVSIGRWKFSLFNPPESVSRYEVVYDYDSLAAPDISSTIDFELIEIDDETAEQAVFTSGNAHRILVSGENTVIETRLGARLTNKGRREVALASASDEYSSEITIMLVQI